MVTIFFIFSPVSAEEVQPQNHQRDQQIRNLLKCVEVLEKALLQSGKNNLQKKPSTNFGESTDKQSGQVPQLTDEEKYEHQQLIRAAFERELIERGGLLLPPRTFEFEQSLSYVHSSSDQIVIDGFTVLPVLVVGDIFSERIRRDQFTYSGTFRAGLPFDMQLDIRVPFRHEKQRAITADNEEINDNITGVGDLEASLSYQILKGGGRFPDVLASLRWKSKTGKDPFRLNGGETLTLGSGFNSYDLTLTSVKVKDPVVFFGGVSFTRTDGERKPWRQLWNSYGDVARIKPGCFH